MAVLMSMALPGWGHLYLRRRALAAYELLIGLALLAAALARLAAVFISVLDDEAAPLDLLRACVPWALVLAAYSVADGAFTFLVSRRRMVPAGAQRGTP